MDTELLNAHPEFFRTNVSNIIARLEELKAEHGDVHVRIGIRGEPIWRIRERPLKVWTNAFTCESNTEIEIVGSWTICKPNTWNRLRLWICGVIYPKYLDA